MADKQPKKHKPSQKWKKYIIKGEKAERKKSCPKCGAGVFLSEHKDRFYCGKCSYMEKK